eukprot:Filipodium_phascolosomae@DN1257_c0_g1_i2.p1
MKNFRCNFEGCDKFFKKPAHLERHHLSHTHEKPFICDDCGKTFSRKEHLSRHTKSHDTIREKVFWCSHPNCDKSFFTVQHKRRHELTHTKHISCDICGEMFNKKSLRKHKVSEHGQQESFQCPFESCGVSFCSKRRLTRHLERHDGQCAHYRVSTA